jgi:hypothetical protein
MKAEPCPNLCRLKLSNHLNLNNMAKKETRLFVTKSTDKQQTKPGLILKTEKFGRTLSKPVNVKKDKDS